MKRDIVANEVSKKCRCSRKEPRETTRVARAQFNRVIGGEMQKGVGPTECRKFVPPFFPHRLGDVRDGGVGISRREIRRVIKFGQRAGKIACPVVFKPLRHVLTLVGTPQNQGNHSDTATNGIGVVPIG